MRHGGVFFRCIAGIQAPEHVRAEHLIVAVEIRKLDRLMAHWQFGEMLETLGMCFRPRVCDELQPVAPAILRAIARHRSPCLNLAILSPLRVECSEANGARFFDAQRR